MSDKIVFLNAHDVKVNSLLGSATIDGIRYIRGDIFDKLLAEHDKLKEKGNGN